MDKFKNDFETVYDENVVEILLVLEDGMNMVKSTARDDYGNSRGTFNTNVI